MRIFRTLLLILLGGASVSGQQRRTRPAAGLEHGLTTQEFREFARGLPELPGRILRVSFFSRPQGAFPGGIAVLVGGEQGWQLFIFLRAQGRKFHLTWKSGALEDTFSSSSERNLRIFDLGDAGDVVQFDGCVSSICSDVFSILLFVPAKKAAFKVHYVQGRTTYSPGLEASENLRYKNWLDKQIAELSWPTQPSAPHKPER